jgi:hypothetical protein
MADLDSIQAGRDQGLESLAASPVAGMRPDRDAASLVHDGDCVFDQKSILGHERTAVRAQVADEGVAEIVHRTAGDHRACNVRPSNRAAIRLLKDFFERERNSQCIEPVDDLFGASVTRRAQFPQSFLQGIEMGQMEREQMDFVILMEHAELRAGDYSNAGALTRFARPGHSIDSVVIRECESSESASLRGLDYLLGR